MKNKYFITFLIFIFSLQLLCAEKIIFSADSMTGQAGNKSSSTTLNGEAFVQTDSMKIQADSIELTGNDYRYIKAKGKVEGKNLDTNMEFTCQSLTYDRETKIATLQGEVTLIDADNDVTAKAEIIEYNQNTDTAILQIKINLTQKDNVCSGAYAIYLKKQQMLELNGNAQIKQKNDTFRAQHITLNMDTQEITLDGNVRGSVTETKNKDKKENSETETVEETDTEGESAEVGEEKSDE